MVRNVIGNRFISGSEIRSQVNEVRNVTVSFVRRRLAERNLKAFRPVRAPQKLNVINKLSEHLFNCKIYNKT